MSPDHGGMKRAMRGNLNLRKINLKLHRSAVGKQKGEGAGQHRGGTVMGSSVERGVCRRGEEIKGKCDGNVWLLWQWAVSSSIVRRRLKEHRTLSRNWIGPAALRTHTIDLSIHNLSQSQSEFPLMSKKKKKDILRWQYKTSLISAMTELKNF